MSSGVFGLAQAIRECVNQRIEFEARAMKGVIQNGLFVSSNGSFVCQQAVEVNPHLSSYAIRSKSGMAVIVGQ